MSWATLIDKDGEKLYKEAKASGGDAGIVKRRNKVVAAIDTVLSALAGTGKLPRGWVEHYTHASRGDMARATVRLGSRPIALQDHGNEVHVPSERLPDFYRLIREDVANGGFDKNIAAVFNTDGTEVKTDKPAGAKRAGWSEERRAQQARMMQERHAAKRAGTAGDEAAKPKARRGAAVGANAS